MLTFCRFFVPFSLLTTSASLIYIAAVFAKINCPTVAFFTFLIASFFAFRAFSYDPEKNPRRSEDSEDGEDGEDS